MPIVLVTLVDILRPFLLRGNFSSSLTCQGRVKKQSPRKLLFILSFSFLTHLTATFESWLLLILQILRFWYAIVFSRNPGANRLCKHVTSFLTYSMITIGDFFQLLRVQPLRKRFNRQARIGRGPTKGLWMALFLYGICGWKRGKILFSLTTSTQLPLLLPQESLHFPLKLGCGSSHQFGVANSFLITFPSSETIFVVTELVHGGSLESLLKCKEDESNEYANVVCELNDRQLLRIALQVALGMQHLEEKKVGLFQKTFPTKFLVKI